MDISRQTLIQAIEVLGLDPNEVMSIRIDHYGGTVDLACTVEGDRHLHPHQSDSLCRYTVRIRIVD